MLKTIGLILMLLPISLPSHADESLKQYFEARSAIGLGFAQLDVDAKVRASVDGLGRAAIDLDDLGLDDDYLSWAIEGRWRFSERWMLIGLAYRFDESGDRSIKRDFYYDGREFQAGATLKTELAVDTYILDVMYSAWRSSRGELLVGGGLHAVDMEVAITGRAFVGDIERERSTGSSELLAPLPNLRAQGLYEITDRWTLNVALGWLSLNYDDYEGRFAYIHPRIGYNFTDNWTLTLGYQYVDLDVTHEESGRREIEFNMDFTGPTVIANYRF